MGKMLFVFWPSYGISRIFVYHFKCYLLLSKCRFFFYTVSCVLSVAMVSLLFTYILFLSHLSSSNQIKPPVCSCKNTGCGFFLCVLGAQADPPGFCMKMSWLLQPKITDYATNFLKIYLQHFLYCFFWKRTQIYTVRCLWQPKVSHLVTSDKHFLNGNIMLFNKIK